MTGWQERKATGDRHEALVMGALEARGWSVHPCGQDTYPLAVQQALGRTDSALRYFPDLLAARGREVVAVDCKARMSSTHTGRFAISRTCLRAGLQFVGVNAPLPLFYVFGDLSILTPSEVMHYCSIGLRHPGGSYYLVDTSGAHQFDEVFGEGMIGMTA